MGGGLGHGWETLGCKAMVEDWGWLRRIEVETRCNVVAARRRAYLRAEARSFGG
jgi:hypothetical protein